PPLWARGVSSALVKPDRTHARNQSLLTKAESTIRRTEGAAPLQRRVVPQVDGAGTQDRQVSRGRHRLRTGRRVQRREIPPEGGNQALRAVTHRQGSRRRDADTGRFFR